MLVLDTDVLIIGAGPAGAAMALCLLNEEEPLRVTVVEQSDLDRVRVGENVASSLFQFLEYLKLDREDFEPETFAPSQGLTSYWGSDLPVVRDAIFSADQPAVQIDREKFDLHCIGKVAERGGRVFPRTRCLSLAHDNDSRWEVELEHSERGRMRVSASILVDATGRQATIGRMAGLHSRKYDKLVGVGRFLRFEEEAAVAQTQVIEATELGWWYTAALPNHQRVVTFFTDADLVAKHKLNENKQWLEHLGRTAHIKAELVGGVPDDQSWVRNAFTQITRPDGVDRFLSIGDAACSFDPVSSMGIGFAISSACQAARIVMKEISNITPETFDAYHNDIVTNFEQYRKLRGQFYGREQRWPHAEFWMRRQPATTAAV